MQTSPAATPQPAAASSAPRRPLIVRVRNWVGDVVLGLPALRLIEAQGYSLVIVARGKWAPPLLAGTGWPIHVQPQRLRDKVRQLRTLRAQCRQIDPGFDRRENALVLPDSFSSALEMRLAGLRCFGTANDGRSALLSRSVPIVRGKHSLISYWRLASSFLRLQGEPPAEIGLPIAPGKMQQAQQLLRQHGVSGNFVLICPFAAGLATARKLNKKWPDFARFVQLADQQLGLPLVVYPGPGEDAQASELYPAARQITGADIAIYAALLQAATLVVANDTGPAHMAAALGARLISVLGPTVAEEWAPWGPRVTVLQKPQPADSASDANTAWPTAEEVLKVARQMLADVPDISAMTSATTSAITSAAAPDQR
jgi:heptosyltransferase-2